MKWSRLLDFSLFQGIGRKVLLSFLFLSLVPLLISTVIGYRSSREELSRAVIAQLNSLADFKVYRITEFLDPAVASLESLVNERGDILDVIGHNYPGPLPGNHEATSRQIETLFSGIISGSPAVVALGVAHAEGRLLAVRPRGWMGIGPGTISFEKIIRSGSRSPGLAVARIGPGSQPYLIISCRIPNPEGESGGLILGFIEGDRLAEVLGRTDFGRTGEICLISQGGNLIYCSMFASVADSSPEPLNSFGISRCLEGHNGSGVYTNHRDRKVQGVYRWLPSINACLLAELDTEEAFATLNSLRNQAVTVGLGLVVLLVLTSIFLTRGITRPIHRLVTAVQETALGDLGKEVTVESNDEMGMLAMEFNVMAEKLRLSYAGLEEKVEKGTKELKSAQDQLIQIGKLAAVGELAGGMAHEINNPTSIILTRVGYLLSEMKDGRLSPEFEEDLKTLETHAKRIARITNGLLAFSRHSTFELTSVRIADVLEGSIGIVEHRFRRNGVKLFRDIPPELPIIVADANYLEQVFINLLNNAVDAMDDQGEIRVKVRQIAGRGDGSAIEIWVSDTGSGIAPEHVDKIFDPFFTTKEVGKGTGLGLSISYGIIQEHGGTIRVSSRQGKGATFIITLPVSQDGDGE